MIVELLRVLIILAAVLGWIFFIISIIIFTRWNTFVARNPNAQDIINEILLRVIFSDNRN